MTIDMRSWHWRRIAGRSTWLCLGAIMALSLADKPVLADDGERAIEKAGSFSVRNIRKHQQEFQRIATRNNGIRAAGTAGYDESAEYVRAQLEEAGYDVELQAFDFVSFNQLGPSILEQTAPGSVVYEENVDYALMSQTDAGDVSGAVTPVDLSLTDRDASSSGCEAADFAGFPSGNIALMQRGACSFQAKAENAAAAGAVGAIVFNQGNTPEREVLFGGTLSAEYQGGIPVVSMGFGLGAELAATDGLMLRMVADTERTTTTTSNVLAERPGAAPSDAMVIVMGAHLDSVQEGPGVNDNGSGSAVILEIALQLEEHDIDTDNRILFAWWGAEESGLIGSQHYVDSLSEDELAEIGLNLNFDMVGSPNFVRFVYDGDGSDTELVGPAGSEVIEQLFLDYFDLADLETEPTAFDGRSDYGPFIAVGIPAGGLFSGAEGIKTEEQVTVYGGTAGEQYDPCYHIACDTFDNNSNEVLEEFSRATAAVLFVLAFKDLPLVDPGVTATAGRTMSASAAMQASGMEYLGNHLAR